MNNGHGSNGASQGGGQGQGAMDPVEVAMALATELEHNVRDRPVMTLSAAFGVGYVLGGGVPNFVLRIGGAIALRAVASRAMSEMVGAGRPTEPNPRGPIDVEHRSDVESGPAGSPGSGPS